MRTFEELFWGVDIDPDGCAAGACVCMLGGAGNGIAGIVNSIGYPFDGAIKEG